MNATMLNGLMFQMFLPKRKALRSGFRLHVDLHLKAKLVGRITPIASPKRNRLARRTRDGDPDEVAIADDAVGRIELHPARTRDIDLAPGMRRAAAKMLGRVAIGHVNIAGDEAGRESERSR